MSIPPLPLRRVLSAGTLFLFATVAVLADTTPQTLPFSQNWSNPGLITVNDDWSGVPGIEGFLGQDITTATGTDPQTLLGVSALPNDLDVIANQSSTAISNGGVAEFDGIANPTIALQGSGTADAPYVLFHLSTVGQSNITVSYKLRDLDGTADNAIQRVALHFRVGTVGSFTNVPAAFVADATTGPNQATKVSPVCVVLPSAVDNQPEIQVRVMTTNAVGNDEWVGVDDVDVSTVGTCPPVGVGSVNPAAVLPGNTTLFTVVVTPGSNPPSTGLTVTGDLTPIGGLATQVFFDDGTNGDVTPGDNVFSYLATVSGATAPGPKTVTVTVTDAQARTTTTTIGFDVQSPPLAIHAIQGTGTTSPLSGVLVSADGIVTGLRSNGFFLQEPDTDIDGDPSTSEGIFVFTSSAPPAAAAIGNSVDVTGRVTEFVPSQDPGSPPTTEITSPTVALLGTGNPLPAPITLTAADTSPAGSIEQLERFEGMRVSVPSLTVVAPTQGNVSEPNATSTTNGVFYGVITGIARPFREPGIETPDPFPPGSPCCIPVFDANPERLRVDSDGQTGTAAIEVTTGATVTGLVGPVDYAFRTYTILPDLATPPGSSGNVSTTPLSAPTASQFTVASFNMERFFDTVNDPPPLSEPVLTPAAFASRLNKASLAIRNIMRTPDILGVEEVENLSTLQAVATKVNSDAVANGDPDPQYQAYLMEGNDIGGIDVGFLVKSSRVAVVDVTQVGAAELFVNPDLTTELLNDRPSLVLRARIPASGAPFTVIVNHLRSLSGIDDPSPGPNGWPTVGARVRAKRRAQAEFLANYIQGRQAADPNERIISIGDYNAFQFNDGYVDSMGTIKGSPTDPTMVVLSSPDLVNPNLVDLGAALPAVQHYSFTFDGNAQTLDHELVTSNVMPLVAGVEYARNGADFPESFRNDANRPERLTDHDQPLAYFTIPTADLSIANTDSPDPVTVGDTVTYTLTVTNNGPHTATGVGLIDDLPFTAGAVITPSQGNCSLGGNVLTCSLGALASGATATVTVALTAPSTPGVYTNGALVSANEPDPGPGANSDSEQTTVNPVPAASITDVAVTEGDGGTTPAGFTVSLSVQSSKTVTVDFATADDTASAPADYVAASGTLTFAAGETSKPVVVQVNGDTLDEPNEAFVVNLTGAGNATISDNQGIGTINDDDAAPTLSIDDVTVTEGDTGSVDAVFTVTLSVASGQQVSVDYATADGTATAPADYTAANGTFTFSAGQTSRTVSLTVNGDTIDEPDETFSLGLSGASNATIADGQGDGTITNDELPAADFNADGSTDILWRHRISGKNVAWYMDGVTRTAGVYTNPDQLADTNWKMVGTADFDDDSKTDILWRHAVSGKNVVWYMDGITRTAGVFTNPSQLADTNWRMAATGDFDIDGRPDILFRHAISGKNAVWLMDGITRTAGVFTNPSQLADTNWRIVGSGDFNVDGKADILWRHANSGKNAVWYMDGVSRTAGVYTSPDTLADTNWQMAGVGDFSADHKPDILFRHQVSGRNVVWYMDGVTRTSGVFTNPSQLADTNWEIVGPR